MHKLKTWDASEHLDSEEMIVAYITAAIEDGDDALVSAALEDVCRAFEAALQKNDALIARSRVVSSKRL